ncbi:MAG TPA: hypothetical protein VGR57_05975 [Ktedonobacterales bacterium]|nr:hypothetical protein [Ktedonobacterales bacterium]
MLRLSALGALLLLAGCGASASGATAGSVLPNSVSCATLRAVAPTPRGPLPTIPAGAHRSYQRTALPPLPFPPRLVYHAGATVHFTWCAFPNPYQVTTRPVPETLTAGFIGPFATRADAIADQRPGGRPSGSRPPGPLVASTNPLRTTTWSDADATAALTLPATLAAGYYVFFARDDVAVDLCPASSAGGCGGGGDTGGGVVQIAPA